MKFFQEKIHWERNEICLFIIIWIIRRNILRWNLINKVYKQKEQIENKINVDIYEQMSFIQWNLMNIGSIYPYPTVLSERWKEERI